MATAPDPSLFGERLAAAIAVANVTQVKLAKDLGVSPNTISNWKKGTHHPHHHRLSLISSVLGVSVGQLIGSEPAVDAQTSAAAQRTALDGPSLERLAKLGLLDALEALHRAQPQILHLAAAIPDLLEVLSEAQRRAQGADGLDFPGQQ